jgi:hypothetical protein
MKSVRDACIGLDGEFLEMNDSLARKNLQQEFSGINNRINQSLHTISENIQPYSGDKRVEELLEKLNEVLISR